MEDSGLVGKSTEWLNREPAQQVEERNRDLKAYLEQSDHIKQFIARLEERIAIFDSVQAIPEDIRLDEKKFQIQVAANAQTVEQLSAELNYFLTLQREFEPKQA